MAVMQYLTMAGITPGAERFTTGDVYKRQIQLKLRLTLENHMVLIHLRIHRVNLPLTCLLYTSSKTAATTEMEPR